MHNNSIKESLVEAHGVLRASLEQDDLMVQLDRIAEMLARAFEAGNKLLICGNGGSACDAMHCAEEFTGRFKKDRQALGLNLF